MDRLGVFPCKTRIPHYGVPIHTDEPLGFPYTTAFGNMAQQCDGLVLVKLHTEQRCAFSFGKSLFACAAVEQADTVIFTEPPAYRQIICVTFSVIRAFFILTTEF
jgi:hypothetical protein